MRVACPFPLILSRLRHEHGLTGKDLAALVGCSHTALYAWERGKSWPTTNWLHRLAVTLGVTPNYLLGWAMPKISLDNWNDIGNNCAIREYPEWELIMAFEIVEKKRRVGSEHKISITSNGTFIINSSATAGFVGDRTHADVYVDKNDAGATVAFHFTKKPSTNTYVVTKHKSASSLSAKATLDKIGYRKNNKHEVFNAQSNSISVGGRTLSVLKIEIAKDLLRA